MLKNRKNIEDQIKKILNSLMRHNLMIARGRKTDHGSMPAARIGIK